MTLSGLRLTTFFTSCKWLNFFRLLFNFIWQWKTSVLDSVLSRVSLLWVTPPRVMVRYNSVEDFVMSSPSYVGSRDFWEGNPNLHLALSRPLTSIICILKINFCRPLLVHAWQNSILDKTNYIWTSGITGDPDPSALPLDPPTSVLFLLWNIRRALHGVHHPSLGHQSTVRGFFIICCQYLCANYKFVCHE